MTVNILIHEWMMFIVNVGEYASPMDPLGYLLHMKMKHVYYIYIYVYTQTLHKLYIYHLYTLVHEHGWLENQHFEDVLPIENGRTL